MGLLAGRVRVAGATGGVGLLALEGFPELALGFVLRVVRGLGLGRI
jgi:hypothetical protein